MWWFGLLCFVLESCLLCLGVCFYIFEIAFDKIAQDGPELTLCLGCPLSTYLGLRSDRIPVVCYPARMRTDMFEEAISRLSLNPFRMKNKSV